MGSNYVSLVAVEFSDMNAVTIAEAPAFCNIKEGDRVNVAPIIGDMYGEPVEMKAVSDAIDVTMDSEFHRFAYAAADQINKYRVFGVWEYREFKR